MGAREGDGHEQSDPWLAIRGTAALLTVVVQAATVSVEPDDYVEAIGAAPAPC
jgi:hypothetical protein